VENTGSIVNPWLENKTRAHRTKPQLLILKLISSIEVFHINFLDSGLLKIQVSLI
jgi:hypothetical protein